jgi:hypothetical protein
MLYIPVIFAPVLRAIVKSKPVAVYGTLCTEPAGVRAAVLTSTPSTVRDANVVLEGPATYASRVTTIV